VTTVPFGSVDFLRFGNRFRNLLGNKCAKRYSYSFRFDIFIARCLGGPFLPVVDAVTETLVTTVRFSTVALLHRVSKHICHAAVLIGHIAGLARPFVCLFLLFS